MATEVGEGSPMGRPGVVQGSFRCRLGGRSRVVQGSFGGRTGVVRGSFVFATGGTIPRSSSDLSATFIVFSHTFVASS